MKTIELFKKAKFLYHSGHVRKTDESDKKMYFEVFDPDSGKTHHVTLEQTGKGWVTSCKDECIAEDDCTSRSLSKGSPHLCAHIIAVSNYMYFNTKLER